MQAHFKEPLYEDNHLIAVYKRPGIPTQGDSTGIPSLIAETKEYLRVKYKKSGNVFLGLVHRLDKPVSGIVLFAKTSKAASRISEQIRNRSVQKTYWTVVEGEVSKSSQILQDTLRWDEENRRMRWVATSDGKESVLRYQVIRSMLGKTLLKVEPLTGRKHQIRCQLSHTGHPILGDVKYGAKKVHKGSIALFLHSVEFMHPVRQGERIRLVLEADASFARWFES